MRISLCLLLAAACVLADESEDRRSKLPYVADAVGNTLPPPSNVPATVGSPVNLLTPDRYEFYTFDESGELVKRLMTLEEIQAIVAAGEETEGLVTFANDNQPTIAFNFSQPPYTKVHSVVTNVQNVLKAQMEAHKNKPLIQPTLDTPDVSDSWSLILPSIFGNTGVDIVPDKTSGTFTTPETETFELDHSVDNNYLSKEGTNQIISSSSTIIDEVKEISVTEKIIPTSEEPKTNPTTTSTSTTTTPKPKATTTTAKPTTTTAKPTTTTAKLTTTTTTTTIKPTTTTTKKLLSTTTSTFKPTTTTTKATTTKSTTTSTTTRPRVSTTTTRRSTTSSTSKPRTTTTIKPTTKTIVRTTPKATTVKPNLTTKKQFITTQKDNGNLTRIQVQTVASPAPTTEKATVKYEKINTFNPISTAAYVTERTTQKPIQKTKPAVSFASTTKRSVSTTTKSPSTTTKILPSITTYKPSFTMVSQPTEDRDNLNGTTVTTQSVSPSTTATVSSTEFISIENKDYFLGKKPEMDIENNNDVKEEGSDQVIPLFDVAQSFSQIASDLGNYQPIPTTSDLLDTTKLNDMNIESKESLEIDIPADVEKDNDIKNSNLTEQSDNFVKISTINPHDKNEKEGIEMKNSNSGSESKITMELFQKIEATTNLPTSTTIDPVLSESMDDLLSQVVNQTPQIVDPVRNSDNEMIVSTTENVAETTTDKTNEVEVQHTTTEVYEKLKNISLTEAKESHSESIKNSTTITTENKVPLPVVEIIDSKNKSKPFDHEKITEQSPHSIKKTETNQNFVQISISTNKNDSKSETTTLMSALNTEVSDHKTQEKTEKLQEKENTTPSNVNKKVPSDSSNKINIEEPSTTTELLQTMTTDISSNPPKKFENTLSQPVINKIVSVENNEMNHMKDKTSEPLPKIEEFKKKIQKVNIDDKELANERNNSWKLISTVAPPKTNEIPKDKVKTEGQDVNDKDIVLEFSKENQGLEVTTKDLGDDIAQFTELCNELAFRYWHAMVESIDKKRSFVLSPYSITSMLAMMFMGARGATSGEMNEILKLDDMVTFNPHFTLKNISDSIETNPESGVIVSAFIRELFSDRSKGKILTFYKERAQQFYNGHVEEINFKLISDIIRRRTNLLVKRYSWGRIPEYMKSNTITMQPPLAAFSANIFQTDCSGSSVDGRDGEMYFVVSPNVRQRRLVPVPAVVYRSGFLAGYDPVLDATAAALGNTNSIISTLFLMPGQQGNVVHAEDLEALEKRLLDSNPTTPAWNRLLRTLLPRIGLELQIPRFSHKSTFNVSSTLRKMGLKDIFNAEHADLGGLNGPSKDLFLSDMIQSTSFVTCGEGVIGEQHQIEEYPENLGGPQRRRTSRWATGWDEPRDYQRAFHDPHDVGEAMHLPLHLRPRQARVPARNAQPARLKFDRPFLYFVRHNPSGMILYVGRYNPRLLP